MSKIGLTKLHDKTTLNDYIGGNRIIGCGSKFKFTYMKYVIKCNTRTNHKVKSKSIYYKIFND